MFLLFSAASGVTAYDGLTGLKLWSIQGAVPEETDPAQEHFYLTEGTTLIGVDPLTGNIIARASGSAVAGSAGMFSVRDGVALGLDQGPNGEAWGYDVRLQRVTWTSPGLPWPHYFVDISGIGGSAEPGGSAVIVADCAKLAPQTQPSAPGSASSSASLPRAARPPHRRPEPRPARQHPAGLPRTGAAASASAAPSPSGQLCQDPQLIAIER